MAATKASTTKSGGAKSCRAMSGPTKSAPRCRRAPENERKPSRRDPAAERPRAKPTCRPRSPRCRRRSRHGRADPRARHADRAGSGAADVLRDAGIRQGRQGHLLLPGEVEVQGSLLDLGFQPDARLDDGEMWPVAFAVTELTPRSRSADRRAREEGSRLRPVTIERQVPRRRRTPPISHDLIRVQGARVNNLKDISIEIPKRRLTVFTGVSGSGKSSLVFDTIAAESRRLIDETYSTFVQVFMPNLARPDVDVLEGLTTAILVDQERLGANPRSTLGTVTDANAMLRSLFSRLGKPYIGGPTAFSFNIPTTRASGVMTGPKGEKKIVQDAVYLGGMCAECEGRGTISDLDLSVIIDESKSLAEGAILVPGYTADGWMVAPVRRVRLLRPEEADQGLHREGAPRPAVQADDEDQGPGHQHHLRRADPEDPQVDVQQGRRLAAAAHQGVRRAGRRLQDLSGL